MPQPLETLIQELNEKIDRYSILEITLTPSYTGVAGPYDTPETRAERLRDYVLVRELQLGQLLSARALQDPQGTELVARIRKDLSRLEAQLQSPQTVASGETTGQDPSKTYFKFAGESLPVMAVYGGRTATAYLEDMERFSGEPCAVYSFCSRRGEWLSDSCTTFHLVSREWRTRDGRDWPFSVSITYPESYHTLSGRRQELFKACGITPAGPGDPYVEDCKNFRNLRNSHW